MPRRRGGRGGNGDGNGTVRKQQETLSGLSATGRSVRDGGSGTGRETRNAAPPRQADDLVTRRSGRRGDAPHGPPKDIQPGEDADVRRALEMENSGAVVLADRGYHVQQNPSPPEVARARIDAGDVGDPGKAPDYLLEGRVFDCYSPVKPTKNVRGIWTEAKEKVEDGQTQRVVVNLEDWRGDLAALKKQFADWPLPGLKEVKAITPEGDIVQIDLPPYRPMEEHSWRPSTS